MKTDWQWLEETAEREVEEILGGLPDEIREVARGVTVFFERVDPMGEDLLGVFEGADLSEEMVDPGSMPRISLFLETIWEMCEGDRKLFREEVHITFLHELGHYFGWDEDEVEERGLG